MPLKERQRLGKAEKPVTNQQTRLARIINLINLIDSAQSHSAAQIARALGVSKRTVYRDLAILEQCGVPTLFEETTAGYSLPSPISCRLNTDELTSLLIAMHSLHLRVAPLFGRRLRQASAKLAQLLPASEHDALKKLWKPFGRPPGQKTTRNQEDHLLTIFNAVKHDRALNIKCINALTGSRTIRIRPAGVRIRDINWELIGSLAGQQEPHCIQLDHILRAEIDE